MKQIVILASLAAMLTISACGQKNEGAAEGTAEKETGMKSDMAAENAMKSDAKPDPSNPYMDSETGMHDKMMAAKGADAAEMWTRKMIEHHKGALTMSEVALKKTDDAVVRKMAQKTIDMQGKEILELQKMLTNKGKAAQ